MIKIEIQTSRVIQIGVRWPLDTFDGWSMCYSLILQHNLSLSPYKSLLYSLNLSLSLPLSLSLSPSFLSFSLYLFLYHSLFFSLSFSISFSLFLFISYHLSFFSLSLLFCNLPLSIPYLTLSMIPFCLKWTCKKFDKVQKCIEVSKKEGGILRVR